MKETKMLCYKSNREIDSGRFDCQQTARRPFPQFKLLLIFLILLTGCPPSALPPPVIIVPDNYLFYKNDSEFLYAVDPQSSEPIPITATETSNDQIFTNGNWDVANARITNRRIRAIIFSGNDGKIYWVSGVKGDSLSPTQISNEDKANTICSTRLFPDSDDVRMVYAYELPGSDNLCNTKVNNRWRMVRLGMKATAAPITIKNILFALYDVSNGSIVGFLASDDKSLFRCNSDFQCDPELIVSKTKQSPLASNIFSGQYLLVLDNEIFSYDLATRLLSPAKYTMTTPPLSLHTSDSTHVYFVDGSKIIKLALNGQTDFSEINVERPAEKIVSINLTGSFVVYGTDEPPAKPTQHHLKTISKDGGTGNTLLSSTSPLDVMVTTNHTIYYNDFDNTKAGSIREDGTLPLTYEKGAWVGQIESRELNPSGSYSGRLVLIEGCVDDLCTGATITTFDAESNVREQTSGTIKSSFVCCFDDFIGIGENALGIGEDTEEIFNDIFFIKANTPNSLNRITNTPDDDEFPLPLF